MAVEPRRWQTEIWLDEQAEPITVYGESLERLHATAKTWLLAHDPSSFQNAPVTYGLPGRIKRYFYSDGTKTVPIFSVYECPQTETLPKGWYCLTGVSLSPQPQPLADQAQAIDHFIETALIPEIGPDYKEVSSNDKLIWLRFAVHPIIHGAIVGLISAVCFIAAPIRGGTLQTWLHLETSPLPIFIFTLLMILLFALLGPIIFSGLTWFKRLKKENRIKHS